MEAESLGRLMDSVLAIRKKFEEQLRMLDEQITESRGYLKELFRQQENNLAGCLSGIDDKLLACSLYVEEYQRRYANLQALKEKLSRLGVEGIEMPEPLRGRQLEEIISSRLAYLRSQGKI